MVNGQFMVMRGSVSAKNYRERQSTCGTGRGWTAGLGLSSMMVPASWCFPDGHFSPDRHFSCRPPFTDPVSPTFWFCYRNGLRETPSSREFFSQPFLGVRLKARCKICTFLVPVCFHFWSLIVRVLLSHRLGISWQEKLLRRTQELEVSLSSGWIRGSKLQIHQLCRWKSPAVVEVVSLNMMGYNWIWLDDMIGWYDGMIWLDICKWFVCPESIPQILGPICGATIGG